MIKPTHEDIGRRVLYMPPEARSINDDMCETGTLETFGPKNGFLILDVSGVRRSINLAHLMWAGQRKEQ